MRMILKKKELISFVLFLSGAILILFTSFHYFQGMIVGIVEDKIVKDQLWYNVIFRIHIVCGLIAIFTGPFQLMDSFRNKYLILHKRLGYLYMTSVMISALGSLIIAQYAIGGIVSTLGFSALAIAWLYTLTRSLISIKKNQIQSHKFWLYINYALTFSSIPQRFFLALALIPNLGFVTVYRLSAWIPWILTILVAVYLYRRTVKKQHA